VRVTAVSSTTVRIEPAGVNGTFYDNTTCVRVTNYTELCQLRLLENSHE
jgi:hypothetical protein